MSHLRKKTIDDIDFAGHRVMVRVDFNVPMENGAITDDRRIREALPTIRKIVSGGGIPIIMSHLGRPDGKYNPDFSLRPIAKRLEELLGRPVTFIADELSQDAINAREHALQGDIFLLENTRFYPGEETNDPEFSKFIAGHADIFVNDAFGTAHRKHASTVGITNYMKVSVMGYLVKKEMDILVGLLEEPKRPYLAIIGGSKVSSKLPLLNSMMDKCDKILVGGAMASTFFGSLGISQGCGPVEKDKFDTARAILEKTESVEPYRGHMLLPIDQVVTNEISPSGFTKIYPYDQVPEDVMVADIGPDSIARFKTELDTAQTIVMNGPVGVFELEQFATGTRELLKKIGERVSQGAVGILGGGDSAAAAAKFGLEDQMTHISTGGGASLKLLEGSKLPAIEALSDR
jgi:3-phosphoglycerate kinase